MLIGQLPEDSAFARAMNRGFSPQLMLVGETVRWVSALVRMQAAEPSKIPPIELPWDAVKPEPASMSLAAFTAQLQGGMR